MKKAFVLLRSMTGHDFSKYKPSTIRRRIDRRLAVNQIESIENYVKYLEQTPKEAEALFRDLLIGVTSFFRDKDAFAKIEQEIIPKLFEGKPADSAVRVWCTGCSTGEEAYSLAILLQEHLEKTKRSFPIQVFASDIDKQAIAAARSGFFPSNIAADLTPERLSRFFTIEPGLAAYRINKTIRDMLVFSEQSVIKDPPFSKVDLITCRNLMIYLNTDLQKKLIPLFHYALNPKGILFLGSSESIGEYDNLFVPMDRKLKIYQRKDDLQPNQKVGFHPLMTAFPTEEPQNGKSNVPLPPPARKPFQEITEQSILRESSMTGILVNQLGDVLYLHGRTGMYLEPSPGEAGINNVVKMAREGLKHELMTGLHQAVLKKEPVRVRDIDVKTNSHYTRVNMIIKPVMAGIQLAANQPLFIIMLEEAKTQDADRRTEPPFVERAGTADAHLEELRNELRIKDEYLQTSMEELESSNEELKSTNEEMQSVNEELQSTNEELETSKEELQSINEELSTVNAELQARVHELSQVNNDMNNLLSGTNIATVFLDFQQRIMRFTPTAVKMINLIASDIGRPVAHIASNLVGYDRLTIDVKAVLDTLIIKESQVQTSEGRWYDMIIQPYRTIDNIIQGAVITFIDITDAKTAKDKLAISELSYRTLFETTKDGILILDGMTGRIVDVNPYLIELLGYSKQEFLDKEIWNIGFLKDVVANKENYLVLQKQKYIRYSDLPLETASGKKIDVEFVSNAYEIDHFKIIQCNIRNISHRLETASPSIKKN